MAFTISLSFNMIFSSPYFLFLALIAPVFSSYVYAIPFSAIASESAAGSDSEDNELDHHDTVNVDAADGKPIAFVLTGDSTTAKAGGWGQWLRAKAVPSTDVCSR
jgi:hypothetical protein